MRPLYDAKVEDLGPDDQLVVECACGHLEHLTAAMLGSRHTRRFSTSRLGSNAGNAGGKAGLVCPLSGVPSRFSSRLLYREVL
jgi:hypothetical protein